jgi:hypothetical protein
MFCFFCIDMMIEDKTLNSYLKHIIKHDQLWKSMSFKLPITTFGILVVDLIQKEEIVTNLKAFVKG